MLIIHPLLPQIQDILCEPSIGRCVYHIAAKQEKSPVHKHCLNHLFVYAYVCCNHPAPRAEGSSRERLEDIANNKYTAKRRLQELETHARSQLVENRATLAAQVRHLSAEGGAWWAQTVATI